MDQANKGVGTSATGRVESVAPGDCRDVNFDPHALPSGMAPSDDPLPSAVQARHRADGV